jgi:hypothetical protein
LLSGAYAPGYSTAVAHSGRRSLRTGIENWWENAAGHARAYQWVSIPAEARSATLRLWYYASSGDWHDSQYVLLYNGLGQAVDPRVLNLSPAANDQVWRLLESDLTAYAGQAVRIVVGCYNDGAGGVTALYVDDVALQCCDGGTGPGKATPSRTLRPTATRQARPTVTPMPVRSSGAATTRSGACRSLAVTGGFEHRTGWVIQAPSDDTGYCASGCPIHGGGWSMRLGPGWSERDSGPQISRASQWIPLPPKASAATLSFWYLASSQDSTDAAYCRILDGAGRVLAEPLRLRWPSSYGWGWMTVTVDLTPFLGQTIGVQFEVRNNGCCGATTLYVDDVAVETCP